MQKKFDCCANTIEAFKTIPATTREARNVVIILIDVISCPFKKGERGGAGGLKTPLSGITWAD